MSFGEQKKLADADQAGLGYPRSIGLGSVVDLVDRPNLLVSFMSQVTISSRKHDWPSVVRSRPSGPIMPFTLY